MVVETRDLHDLIPAFSLAGVTIPRPLPIELENGTARFEGTVTGGLRSPRIEGRVALRDVIYEGRKFDRASASIDLTRGRRVASMVSPSSTANCASQAKRGSG